MSVGPIELLVVKFPGNKFSGEIAPALTELIESGTIRIFDLLFATKDHDGKVTVREIAELDDDEYATIDPLVSDTAGLLTVDDVERLTSKLESNSSAALILFENVWATRFTDAVANANGEVVLNERIPRAVIQELLAERVSAEV
jgi:uncharacterized membrane protein